MKRFLSVILVLIIALSFASCTERQEPESTGETGTANVTVETTTKPTTTEDPDIKRLAAAMGKEEGEFYDGLVAIPDEYYKPLEGGRPTELFTYTYKKYTKNCVVYTPPGYDETKQYNVYYLLGGIMANENAFFNEPGAGSVLQNVFDHMIENGEVEPFIAVNVNFFYTDDNHDADIDYGEVAKTVETFSDELRNAIVPAVENEYATYLEGDREVDYIASRKHRCMGGFSLGSSVAFLTLTHNLDYFYYFAPLCGADFQTYYPDDFDTTLEEDLRKELKKLDYTTDDFFIFATEGSNDNTFMDMNPFMERILADEELFTQAENNKSQGNISYKILEGQAAQHRYIHAYRYYYNSLVAFWGKELREDTTTEVTLNY